MPNQPVTVVYTYEIDPSYVTHVTINRIDNHNNVLAEPETREVSPNETVTVNVDEKPGIRIRLTLDGMEHLPISVWTRQHPR